ncbi:MAG: ABC transporter permease [Candidatus Sumerlaeota bacterium]|nr:ABC transporter permease [Candidatus Sumerlaeota bacterium]
MFRSLWIYRELILSLVTRDLKTRYKGSALGFFWSLCRPLFIMAVLFAVFVVIVPLRFDQAYFNVADDPWATKVGFGVHLMIGILLWNFFASALSESTRSILGNGNLIKKIKMPLEVFPVATVLANLAHLLLAFAVLVPAMLLLGYRMSWLALTAPLLIALLTILTAGFAFMLSAANVFYRDVASLTEIVLMAWFYVTPIFYPASVAYAQLREHSIVFFWLFVANPMATICIAVRRVLFIEGNFASAREAGDATLWKYLLLCTFISLAIYGLGRLMFMRLSARFADEV